MKQRIEKWRAKIKRVTSGVIVKEKNREEKKREGKK